MVKIREAKKDDSRELSRVLTLPEVIKWRFTQTELDPIAIQQGLCAMIEADDAIVWVLEDNDRIIGIVHCVTSVGNAARLDIAIEMKYQGKGIGSKALNEIIPIAFKRLKISHIIAPIREENRRSIHFFEKAGFTFVERLTLNGQNLVGYSMRSPSAMKVCVCGWYYYDSIYETLKQIKRKYPVFIVANQSDEKLEGFDFHLRDNLGLEWGAYDWYLKNKWDGESSMLFMHDDVRIRPIIKNFQLVPHVQLFDAVANLAKEFDQCYLFKSYKEQVDNFGIHGRAFTASPKLLKWLLQEKDGIWYDKDNDGHTKGPTPKHCMHFNEADYRFRDTLLSLNGTMKVNEKAIIPAFDCARRGRFEEELIERP